MTRRALIVGGGIGGLAASLACAQAGAKVELFERAHEFAEVGAGIQLGPNVVKVLHGWGLETSLANIAAFPDRLQIRSAITGAALGCLRLGQTTVERYGWPYATVHRADLHAQLLAAVKNHGQVRLHIDAAVDRYVQHEAGVTLHTMDGRQAHADVLIGADGLWSQVRKQLLNDGAPQATGHLAYRAMVRQVCLPAELRSGEVTAWLGPKMHLVQYPVRGGEWLNVVAIVHGKVHGDIAYWDHSANPAKLKSAMAATCAQLQDLIHAIEHWRLWALSIRAPMRGAREHAQGRVALLGDAAHPMLPYLAQGAGMAIEDAQELGRGLGTHGLDAPATLKRYAALRWQRNARVQARAIQNGRIFHATGHVRWARDAAMKLMGERLLDMPWLYRGQS
jgi:salicylate hydroxylase